MLFKSYAKTRFLIVDDFEHFRTSLRSMLNACGAQDIQLAGTGEEAIRKCSQQHFDAVICDYNLGLGKNGQQVLEEMRFRKILKKTSLFIVVTADTHRAVVMSAIEYQPDGYIAKPITQAALQKRLDRLIQQREALYAIHHAMDRQALTEAIDLCDRQIQAASRFSGHCLRLKAELLYQTGQLAEAGLLYRGILQDRELPWAKLGLGKTELAQKHFDEAETLFSALVEEQPNLIEAYDWLAETQKQRGDTKAAQSTLQKAVAISPKALLRHKQLAHVGLINQDLDTATDALRHTLRLCERSCHEDVNDYMQLVECLNDKAEGDTSDQAKQWVKEAMAVLKKANRRFPEPEIKLHGQLLEARLHAGQGKDDRAREVMDQAEAAYQKLADTVEPELTLEVARSLLITDQRGKAKQLLAELAQHHADDADLLGRIDELLEEPVSLRQRLRARDMTQAGITAYNNGEYAEALAVFTEAIALAPQHAGLNLNFVQSALQLMKQGSVTHDTVTACAQALDRLKGLSPQHRQFRRLQYLTREFKQQSQPL